MRGYDVIEALGGIGDDLILDAKRRRKKPIPVWLRFGAMAACLCCVVMAAAVLSLNLFSRERTPGQEALGSGTERIDAVDVTPKTDDPEIIGNEDRLLTDNDHVILEDEEFGLKLEVPKSMAQDVVCNEKSGVPFALYEPTAYEALYIESLGTGGGFLWEIIVETYDEFYSSYSLDPTEWTTVLPGPEIYMMGRTEEYVYTVRNPSDVQFTVETEKAYKEYKKAGASILKRFLVMNEIEINPEWEEVYPAFQTQTELPDTTQENGAEAPQAEETTMPTEPTVPTENTAPAEDAARDAGVYARDKAYSSKADGVPVEALEEFTVWFETPASDGREKFCTDPWSWTFTTTEGTDLAQWGDVVLECNHENGIDSQMFFWSWGGTITWGPTSSPADP